MISNFDVLHAQGAMQSIPASVGSPVPDPDPDAGPSMFYQGTAIPDPRFIYLKDKVSGYTGVVPMTYESGLYLLSDQIPAAHTTTGIAAAANVVASTAMTLATAQATGISPGVPIIPLSAGLNTGTPVNVLALDFGFAFGNVTAGNKTITVANSAQFWVGMPLVIPGVGNSAATTSLLTIVTAIPTANTTSITVQDAPGATNATAAIGTGNLWGPSEAGFPTPTAALPYVGVGPALILDVRQALCRGVVVTCNNSLGTGGNFLVRGYDIYGAAMSESIAIVPGTSTTAYGKKAFAYIASVTPDFTDATYTYAIGTSDEFGFNLRATQIEHTQVWWNGLLNAASTGFIAGVGTTATTTTGDVRGTILTSAIGNGSGIGGTASNGSIVALAMSGVRLTTMLTLRATQITRGTQADPAPLYGVAQA